MGRGLRQTRGAETTLLARGHTGELITMRRRDLDSLNLPHPQRLRLLKRQADRLEEIVKDGWPGQSEIGQIGALAAWLVAQHSPSVEQQQYFYRQMSRAVSRGEASRAHLAQLEDRILVRQGKKQIYGTQSELSKDGSSHLYPVDDPAGLAERRLEVGLD